eukprot:8674133-Ditylum_brightwellii.AAC.1
MEDGDKPTTMDVHQEDFFSNLQKNEHEIVIPTYKTNGHKLAATLDYINWVKKHMRDAAILNLFHANLSLYEYYA